MRHEFCQMGMVVIVSSLGVVGAAHAGSQEVTVVRRPVVEPAATVSRELSQQPVHPHLVEVKMGTLSVFLDPQNDYIHKRNGGRLSDDHSLMRALRQAESSEAKPTRVIRGQGFDARAKAAQPQPVMIITKPKLEAPRKPEADEKRVARAD